jgi:hypothetical protein
MPPVRVRPPGGIGGKEGAARRVKRLLLLLRPLFAITKRDEMGCPTRSDKSSSFQMPKDAAWEPVCHQFIRHLFAANEKRVVLNRFCQEWNSSGRAALDSVLAQNIHYRWDRSGWNGMDRVQTRSGERPPLHYQYAQSP